MKENVSDKHNRINPQVYLCFLLKSHLNDSKREFLKGMHLQGHRGIHLYQAAHFKKFRSRNLEGLGITDLIDLKNLKFVKHAV